MRWIRLGVVVCLVAAAAACSADGGERLDVAGLLAEEPAITSPTTPSDEPSAAPPTSLVAPNADSPAAVPGREQTPSADATSPEGNDSPDTPHRGGEQGSTERPRIPHASQGVTGSTISIGVPILVNYDTVVNSFASDGQSVGDQRAQAQAVVDHLNERGGMAGRQIEPVYQEWDSGQGTFASQAQRVCAGLTQDHRVFAVANHTYAMETLLECLASANTPLVAGGDTGGWADQAMLDRYADFLYMPSWLNFTRWGVLVDGLVAQDFFGSSVRTGLLYLDEPIYRNGAEQAVKPALARHGISIFAEQAIQFPESAAGVGDTGSAVANAVLRFRTRNIDRVLFVEGVGLIPFLFLPQAESQGYRPVYAIHSSDQASWIVNNAPREQLHGARGMGWLVPNDVPLARDPGDNPTRERCLSIYKASNVEVLTDRFREHSALAICGHLLFLTEALDRAPEVSPAGLRIGAESLAGAFRSPLNFSTSLGPGRHDGAAAVRPMAFDPPCGCFAYTGEPVAAP